MPCMKYHDGTKWIELDADNGDSVNGIHFREKDGKIQYSTDNTNWKNAGAIGTAAKADVLSGKTYSSNEGTELTGTMANHGDVTISPSVNNQTKAAGYIKSLTVNGNANLTAANIKKDVTIFGVKGTLEAVPEINFGSGKDSTLNTTANLTFESTIHTSLIVKEYDSITINAGHTVTVSNPCCGLVLFSKGNVTINGTLDMSQKAGFNPNYTLSSVLTEKNLGKLIPDLVVMKGGNGGSGGHKKELTNGGGKGGGGRINAGGYGGGGAGGDENTTSIIYGGKGGDVSYPEHGGGDGAIAIVSDMVIYGVDGVNGGGGSGFTSSKGKCAAGGKCNGGGGGGGQGSKTQNKTVTKGSDGQFAGGFILIISAGNISIGSSGKILANGGIGGGGGNGCGSGGGGAGGGVIALYHKGTYSNSGEIAVNGGNGGSGAGLASQSGSVGTISVKKLS